MGMTILVSNDKPVLFGVKDIGNYNKTRKKHKRSFDNCLVFVKI